MNIHKCLDTWIDLTHVCAISEVFKVYADPEFRINFLFRDNPIVVSAEDPDLVKEAHVELIRAWMGDSDTQTSNE